MKSEQEIRERLEVLTEKRKQCVKTGYISKADAIGDKINTLEWVLEE